MDKTLHARFVALHDAVHPMLLPNAWDAASARLWEAAGAPAVATSSAAVAWSLGHADGGALPRADLLGSLANIVRVCSVPISVDLEDGYGDAPEEVAELAQAVAAVGAVGINIEDGVAAPELLAAKIRAIRTRLGRTPLFVNARTDVYLRGLAQGDAAVHMCVERLALYREAGADGGFVPGLADVASARAIAGSVSLAVNLMALPGMPAFSELRAAGVRRISMGPALFRAAYGAAEAATRAFLQGNPVPAFDAGSSLDYAVLNRMFSP